MANEYAALLKQGTWELQPLPSGKMAIDYKWVYQITRHPDGSIARHKACLVAKEYHQEEGIDYNETFNPVVKKTIVRVVLSLTTQHGGPLRQLDVKNAFLHGNIHEEVYMQQLQGFVNPSFPNYVYKLVKSLYGLKQAPRTWFECFTSYLLTLGFVAYVADSSLFVLVSNGSITYLLLYVNDIILTGNSSSYISTLVN